MTHEQIPIDFLFNIVLVSTLAGLAFGYIFSRERNSVIAGGIILVGLLLWRVLGYLH